MELKGKTILITGGASGIGLEAAKRFLGIGANVIITGRNEEKLKSAKAILPALVVIKSDVANEVDALSLLDQVEKLGGIDILYNNAGVNSKPINFGKPSSAHYDRAAYEMDINYLGVIRLNNLFMEMLNSRNESAIINTTSILSYVPANLGATYSASKVALRFYTQTLRSHLKILKSKVKVFELLPPLVATEMADGFEGQAISTEKLVDGLINGLHRNHFTIRVGATKMLYMLSRISPKLAFDAINQKKFSELLK